MPNPAIRTQPGVQVPAPLQEFIGRFNAGLYWESHEVLESAWRQDHDGFYHGLILLASAWVHHARRNPTGARAQAGKARRALEPYRPVHLGLDVEALLRLVSEAETEVELETE